MELRRDVEAASPLVVLAVFVLVAAGVTALLFFLFFDRPDPAIGLQAASAPADGFVVGGVEGSFRWSRLDVQFVDAAGVDRAGLYLEIPEGSVDGGDRIALRHQPPAGSYLLRVLEDGQEIVRLAARF